MNTYTPYTYVIRWSHLNISYYGVRFSKSCDPSDLWNTYFTSSKHVTRFRHIHGEPDIIEIRKIFHNKSDALLWEHKVLRRLKVSKNQNYLNKSIGMGHYYCDVSGTKQTPEHNKKRSDSRRGQKQSKSCCEKISEKMKNRVVVRNSSGDYLQVYVDDPRYTSGELIFSTTGLFCAVDASGNKYHISKTDPRYTSGELVAQSKGRKYIQQSEDSIILESLIRSHNIPIASKGQIWIHRDSQGTKIHPALFDLFYKSRGWILGRKSI